jgi:hypothetical protein
MSFLLIPNEADFREYHSHEIATVFQKAPLQSGLICLSARATTPLSISFFGLG